MVITQVLQNNHSNLCRHKLRMAEKKEKNTTLGHKWLHRGVQYSLHCPRKARAFPQAEGMCGEAWGPFSHCPGLEEV